jgi:Bacterial conjugation TrbI-like protein
MSKPGNKAKVRQFMVIGGVVLVIFGVVLLGLKAAEQQPKPTAPPAPIRGQSLKAPGNVGTEGVVGQAVNNSKFAALEDLIKKQGEDAKKREDEIRRDLEEKARKEAEAREKKDSQPRGGTTTTANSSGAGQNRDFKIFDPSKLGQDAPRSGDGPLGGGTKPSSEAKVIPELTVMEFSAAQSGVASQQAALANQAGSGVRSVGAATGSGAANSQVAAPRTVTPQGSYEGVIRPGSPGGVTGAQSGATTGQLQGTTRALQSTVQTPVGRRIETYLPSGTFFKVAVLTGMDAPTGGQAQNNPHPMLLHVTSLGQLPNQFKTDVKHCAITAQGYGDLPAERAYIRTENMSCVRNNGEVIDVPIVGHVIGGDGKVGLRGRVVTKQGQVLSNALWTSMISSFGEMAKLASTNVTVVPGGSSVSTSNSNLSNSDLLKRGALGGLGETAKQLSQYYINLAEKLYPVVEIDGGQTAEVVLSQGVSLLNQTPRGQMSDIYVIGQQLRDLQNPGFQRR